MPSWYRSDSVATPMMRPLSSATRTRKWGSWIVLRNVWA